MSSSKARQARYIEKQIEKGRKRATLWVSTDFHSVQNPATLKMQELKTGQIALVPEGYIAVSLPQEGMWEWAKRVDGECTLTFDQTTKWSARWSRKNAK